MVCKRHIEERHLQEAIRNERQILTMVDSPFIVRLHATFRDSKYLYFLFDPMLGGDLHGRMCRERSRFRNPAVYRFLVGCIVLALEHLHDRNIVYRDLKPENILLDQRGYGKLCDLGFSKFVFGKTTTLCGTPEYMAPEVILHGGYDRMVDWWSLGILTYEFLCGCTPFAEDEDEDCGPEVIFANIMVTREHGVSLPPRVGTAVTQFVASLLEFSPGDRLGIFGTQQVKSHVFLEKLDFQALSDQRLKPGYIPRPKPDGHVVKIRSTPPSPPEGDGSSFDVTTAPVAGSEAWDAIF